MTRQPASRTMPSLSRLIPLSFSCSLLLLSLHTSVATWPEPTHLPPIKPASTAFEAAMLKTHEHSPDHRRKLAATRLLDALLGPVPDTAGAFEEPSTGASEEAGAVGGAGGRRLAETRDHQSYKGLRTPPLKSGPSMAVVNMTLYRWESVSPLMAVDWRATIMITPILRQFSCASCWAIAAVDSIAMMWAISTASPAKPLSPQQVCDCATKQCCQGGWPEWAYAYALYNGGVTAYSNYPYTATDSTTCLNDPVSTPSHAKITGWELVPAHDPWALMKAVSMQPTVAFVSASSSDFVMYTSRSMLKIYNGSCGLDVNHAVVVVGYRYTGPSLENSYWILKNSFYATWGDRGYMYLAMTSDIRGKCGLHTTPAMYPVYYPDGPQPSRFGSNRKGRWAINTTDDLTNMLFPSYSFYTTTDTSTSTSSTTITAADTTASTTSTSSATMASLAAETTTTTTDSGTLTTTSPTTTTTTTTTDPAPTSFFSNDPSLRPDPCKGVINPCGAGRCYDYFGIARCDCSGVAGMVEVLGMPTSKCVSVSPCSTRTGGVNPCGGGVCTDSGDGMYTCSCSPGFSIGTAVDGASTCLPAATAVKTYTAVPGDTCTGVATLYEITVEQLVALNPFLNCTENDYIPPGITLGVSTSAQAPANTSSTSTSPTSSSTLTLTVASYTPVCLATATVQARDSCRSLADRYFVGSMPALLELNPQLVCRRLFRAQQICLQVGPAPTSTSSTSTSSSTAPVATLAATDGSSSTSTALSAPVCGGTYVARVGDTCRSVATKFGLMPTDFTMLNPAADCSYTLPMGSAVCIANKTSQSSPSSCTRWYRVIQGDTCPSIWNSANLTMSMFLTINAGIQCQAPYLAIGQLVCIDSPLVAPMKTNPNVSYTLHTVRADESLVLISAMYDTRCTLASIAPAAIAAANNLTGGDTAALLPVDSKLVIPCAGKFGIIDSGCPTDGPVCGAKFVTRLSPCEAIVNYDVPIWHDGPCSGCDLACKNRVGLVPLSGYGCLFGICPYPTWGPQDWQCSQMVGDAPGKCCTYVSSTCDEACTATMTTSGGTATQQTNIYNNCYAQCLCCSRIPCGEGTCVTPSSCWNQSPRKCYMNGLNQKYYWNCSYFAPANPLP